jgi:hypothetical protein
MITRTEAIATIDAALDGQLERFTSSIMARAAAGEVDTDQAVTACAQAAAVNARTRAKAIALVDNPHLADNPNYFDEGPGTGPEWRRVRPVIDGTHRRRSPCWP